ncbi:NAD(P)H-dependent glycerol-3-phosphate dehydrogenase [Foetidibacter luteolus]|uniref:NAD(P)H-dependent glycerol-3-phosphate dehydrogenase n=1 Tax=Foetidibacter luteolus TaxID=2608880 RepID=UPI00129ABEFF|nr:NAD(P)H-dependent glycerol-3-phosphate dehydrogenase [Foetidibacter luteolus]
MQFGIIGSGSWATALTKMLTDNMHSIKWWVRNDATIAHIHKRKHNPHYLSTAYFNTSLLDISSSIGYVVEQSDVLVVACPSAFVHDVLSGLNKDAFKGKKILSAVKGILPDSNLLLNEYLFNEFDVNLENYFAVLGPCHAEEVAAEKLSYLTFAGVDEVSAAEIAEHFTTDYINTVVTHDVIGVQYAAVLKNVYALGAGIAHGLEYGDNFQSVYIAKCADEMVGFLRKVYHANNDEEKEHINYAASAYLGDLLVTCYSLYSRNRTFGNMIGKGYSVKAAQLELNMVAEGYNASRCMFKTNEAVGAAIPVLNIIYRILWDHLPAMEGFKEIERVLV